MILAALIIVTLISAISAQNDTAFCPDLELIKPCSCDREGIACFFAQTSADVERAFAAPRRKKVTSAVYVNGTPLRRLNANTFNGYKMGAMFLDKNQLDKMESGIFAGTERILAVISVYDNKLGDDGFPFEDLPSLIKLQQLSMAKNKLKHIRARQFAGQPSLGSLMLLKNEIESIGPYAFASPEIRMLALMENKLTTIGPKAFANMTALPGLQIDLSMNKITTIAPDAFEDSIPNAINFAGNAMTQLDPRLMLSLFNIMGLYFEDQAQIALAGNPFDCTVCQRWLWFVVNKEHLMPIFGRDAQCDNGMPLAMLNVDHLGCTMRDLEQFQAAQQALLR